MEINSLIEFRATMPLRVWKFLQKHPNLTSSKIAEAFKTTMPSISPVLTDLYRNDKVTRSRVPGKYGAPSKAYQYRAKGTTWTPIKIFRTSKQRKPAPAPSTPRRELKTPDFDPKGYVDSLTVRQFLDLHSYVNSLFASLK